MPKKLRVINKLSQSGSDKDENCHWHPIIVTDVGGGF